MMSSEGVSKAKRPKVEPSPELGESGDASEMGEMNDSETQKALEEIDGIQNEIDSLNEKASEEILKVEQKYNKLRKPHFDKRNEIIERIPNFWVTAFINHPQISAVVDQEEEECLRYLTKVEVEEFEDIKSGYKISFFFKSNPYFTNELLCKEFHLAQTGDPESKSTKIDWKNGMNLAGQSNTQLAGNDRKQQLPRARRNFFAWFMDNNNPSADDIAEVIKDDMWPNPLQYYLAPDTEVDENGMEDYSDEDDVDESVVVVEDDDEDEEEEVYEVEDEDELDTTGDVEVIEEEELTEEESEKKEENAEELDENKNEEVEDIDESKDEDVEEAEDESEPV